MGSTLWLKKWSSKGGKGEFEVPWATRHAFADMSVSEGQEAAVPNSNVGIRLATVGERTSDAGDGLPPI